jgi:aconitate hydratase
MLGAGLIAKKAVERGLRRQPWVKTSLAPGSTVVTEYLEKAGLTKYLDELQFNLVGYGCTTCIGNSGPLPEEISKAVNDNELVVCSVLSGNRNFEGRINPDTRANYLASPPLVVAYALTGRMDVDLTSEPIGNDSDGEPVHLSDIWPTGEEVKEAVAEAVRADMFTKSYSDVFTGDKRWKEIEVPEGDRYTWPDSTYVRRPSFFEGMKPEPDPIEPIADARVLAVLGDSVTTDHISPAGAIKKDSPAGRWLLDNGVDVRDFNSYGARRGNHEVMIRGTFANVRLRNRLVEKEGGFTKHWPDGEETTIYEAAMSYAEAGVPLVILAGKEYGSGSSRDWAAKGTKLLGIRAVIAESFERIHRSNLIGMGVVPLQFPDGETIDSLGLTGAETLTVGDLKEGEAKSVEVTAAKDDGDDVSFEATVRIDTPNEVTYFRNGGILHRVLRDLKSR